MSKKKILIDMSATIIHYGHVRLINKAKKFIKIELYYASFGFDLGFKINIVYQK